MTICYNLKKSHEVRFSGLSKGPLLAIISLMLEVV